MEKTSLKVGGMSCGHCEKAVVNALEDAGVPGAVASAKEGRVNFEYDPGAVSLDDLKKAIVEAGYEAA
ncbi:MAG: cation transporter [Treponema sp.]|nr:cation transporter [Treponema sp.]